MEHAGIEVEVRLCRDVRVMIGVTVWMLLFFRRKGWLGEEEASKFWCGLILVLTLVGCDGGWGQCACGGAEWKAGGGCGGE
ncbi:MAG: hypothetical protein U0903_12450 [Planctomycetales bacterium]